MFIPLYLGITGHRDIRNEDKPRLKQMIKEIICEKKALCPDTPIVILTSLAEGADRLGAYAALECGVSYYVPLPMPVDEYRKDFAGEESLNEFDELLQKADFVYELPLEQGTTVQDLQHVKEKRDNRYFRTGLFIARQCQMLIALWDGIDNDKQGGTAHIVKLKRSGLPSSHPQLQQRLQNLQSGSICHILTPTNGSTTSNEPFSKKIIYSEYWSSSDQKPQEMDRQLLGHLDALNRDIKSLSPVYREKINQSEKNLLIDDDMTITRPELQLMARFHAIMDSLAFHFKQKHYLALRLLLTLSTLAVLFFMVYLEFWPDPFMLLLFPVTLGLGAVWFIHAVKNRFKRKHADYRALAETFRVQYYLSIAQRKTNISEFFVQKHKGELEWRIYALRAALLRCETAKTSRAPDPVEGGMKVCKQIHDCWVSDQLAYFKKSSLKLRQLHSRLRYTGGSLFLAAVMASLLLLIFIFTRDYMPSRITQSMEWVYPLLVTFSLCSLFASGVVFGYNEIMAFAEHGRTFEKMHRLFRTAYEKLVAAMDAKSQKEAVEIIRELAHESLMENLEADQQELQIVNTLIEEQKEELYRQREELKLTLEHLRRTQEQLVESEKMAALGGLVAGVAHEINTPVGIGITAISSLNEGFDRMNTLFENNEISKEDFREFLDSAMETGALIQKNLDRTALLVQSFKQLSIDQVTEQQRIFVLKEYLNDILLSLQPKFSHKKIAFDIECDGDLQLNSYPGVYAQVLTNLILNSLQHGFYNRDRGTIAMKAGIVKGLLKIEYRDDGAGIDKRDLPHIFEPFYTSDHKRGTGLGLNIVYNLVRQKLHGTIACESEPGKGVLFRIEVPA